MRREKRRLRLEKRSKKSLPKIILLTIIFVVSVFLFSLFKIETLEKFIYVNKATNGDAEIVIVDTQSDKVYKYLITGDTQLDSAREYGNYRMSSLWNLSEKDGNNGSLISETIIKNYFVPVYLWKDGSKSNLNLYQKTKVFLIEKKYIGYDAEFKSFKLPNSVLINFVVADFSENIPTVNIEDLTGSYNLSERVSRIVEIMGGKITLNSKGYDESFDCEVVGKDMSRAVIFSSVFSCDIVKEDKLMTNDIKIRLGAKFSKRF